MTVTVRIPAALQPRTGGERMLTATGTTLGDLLDDLTGDYHSLVNVVRCQGALSRFINVYVNGDDVRDLGGLHAALRPGDEVLILPAVAGG